MAVFEQQASEAAGVLPLRSRLTRSTALVAIGLIAVTLPSISRAQTVPPNSGGMGGGFGGGAGGILNTAGTGGAGFAGGGGGGPSSSMTEQPAGGPGAGPGGSAGGAGGVSGFNGDTTLFDPTTTYAAPQPGNFGGPVVGGDANANGAGAGGGGAGGFGAVIAGTGLQSTSAAITGSNGAAGGTGYGNPGAGGGGGDGGVGLSLPGAIGFTNGGTIAAGNGGGGGDSAGMIGGAGGAGGAGVFSNATQLFTNNGGIDGGGGGAGGAGGDATGGYFGATTAGSGGLGGVGGSGFVATSAGALLLNSGTLTGGTGGAGGLYTGNAGGIGGAGGLGGSGAVLSSGQINNRGTITGGAGGTGNNGGSFFFGGAGGIGGAAGDGVRFTGTGTLVNSGTITGGAGGQGGEDASGNYYAGGGNGGAGVRLLAGGSITNQAAGVIQGGPGGGAATSGGGAPGVAGAGIDAQGGGTIVNLGSTAGGTGSADGGPAGVGISGANLNVVNDGFICGGAAGFRPFAVRAAVAGGGGGCATGAGAAAAIQFTGGINSLTLHSNSIIVGAVVAVAGGADTLALGGTVNQTFNTSAIGPQFQNFASFQKVDSSTWTLTSAPQPGVATPWTILGGTLSIANDASLGPAAGGMLTLSGGTLQTTASTSGTRAIALGTGGGTFDVAAGTTFGNAGGITGAGALTKIGAGTFLIGAPSSYTGATNVQAGTLQGGAANVFSAASLTTINTGGTLDLGGFAQTINTVALAGGTLQNGALTGAVTSTGGTIGNIGGSASVTTTTGTTTFVGANSYTGPTNVNGGTALGGNANALSSANFITVKTGGTLDLGGFAQTGLVELTGGTVQNGALIGFIDSRSGIISNIGGSIGVTVMNGGTTVMTGANTYSGMTVVDSGTLRAGSATGLSPNSTYVVNGTLDINGFNSNIGSLAGTGTVTNNGSALAALTTGGDGSNTSFTGILTDGTAPLRLIKAGAGTFSLSAKNTYSGGTRVLAGTVQVSGAGSLGSGRLELDSGTTLAYAGTGYTLPNNVLFTGASDPTIDSGPGTVGASGVISGPGDLTKVGTGTLILTGQNTYTGNTFINQGRLQVDGSIASSPLTQVANGASLAGVGTVASIAALAGATVAPGNVANPYGVLTATGNVTFANGSTFATSVTPTVASLLAAAGTGTIAAGGALAVSPGAQTFTTAARIPILTTGRGLTGQFSTVSFTSTVLGIQPTVVYDGNNAYLQFGQTNPNNPAGPPILPPLDVASTVGATLRLANDRQGLFVTNRVLASMLMGFNEQINCQDCITGFGSVGSFSLGAHGRKFITNDLSIIGGAAFAEYRSGGIHVTSAPIIAGLLRYDFTELGSSRPFAEIGGFVSPAQRATSTRTYAFGMIANGGGQASTTDISGSVFGRLGWVARLTPVDEVAGGVEVAGGWQHFGGYSEGALPSNPYPITSLGGTDRINIAKVGGQWTHLFGATIETQLNAGVARSFGSRSGLNPVFTNVALPITLGEYTWAEYGARIGYRFQQNIVVDAFADGTLGPAPIRNTIHGGLAARYAF